MNSYELAILYDPDLEIDLDKAADKVKAIVTKNGGTVTAEDNWGKRKLAYNIKGHDMAVYVFYAVDIAPSAVAQVETTLTITDEVIRFLITKTDFKAIKKAESIKASRAKHAKKEEAEKEAEDNTSE